jgi:biopolymer transport protein ExbD
MEVTPLIDVVFQLLIFFLLTTRFITEHSVDVELPDASAQAQDRDERIVLTLDVDARGRVFHEGERLARESVNTLMRRHAGTSDRAALLVRADRSVEHGTVVDLMDRAQRYGLTDLGVGTRLADR